MNKTKLYLFSASQAIVSIILGLITYDRLGQMEFSAFDIFFIIFSPCILPILFYTFILKNSLKSHMAQKTLWAMSIVAVCYIATASICYYLRMGMIIWYSFIVSVIILWLLAAMTILKTIIKCI